MSKWHVIIEDGDNNIVGLFDIGSEARRGHILDNLPDDLSVRNEQRIPDDANLDDSLQTLSDNVVEWDERLIDL